MARYFSKLALAATALAAIPGAAHAGTSTDNKTASFSVINQCTVTGANVNIGTFRVSDTWANVMAAHSYFDAATGTFVTGSNGLEAVNFGSVTCDNDTPYLLFVYGDSRPNYALDLAVNGKTMNIFPMLTKVGGTVVPDTYWVDPGMGLPGGEGYDGVGNGTSQALQGYLLFYPQLDPGANATPTDQMGATGTYADTISYELRF